MLRGPRGTRKDLVASLFVDDPGRREASMNIGSSERLHTTALLAVLVALAMALLPACSKKTAPEATTSSASAAPTPATTPSASPADEAKSAAGPYLSLIERASRGEKTSVGLASFVAAQALQGFEPESFAATLVATEVGTGTWDGREIPAAIVRATVPFVNKAEGKRRTGCVVFTALHDTEFSMWREMLSFDCDDTGLAAGVAQWRQSNKFTAKLVWPGPSGPPVAPALPPPPDAGTPSKLDPDCTGDPSTHRCSGTATPELTKALQAQLALSDTRACITKAFKEKSKAPRTVDVTVRVSAAGNFCTIDQRCATCLAADETMDDDAAGTCLATALPASGFPHPTGTCADVKVSVRIAPGQ